MTKPKPTPKKKSAAKKAPAKKATAKKAVAKKTAQKKPATPAKKPSTSATPATKTKTKVTMSDITGLEKVLTEFVADTVENTATEVVNVIRANDVKSANTRKRMLKWFRRK